MLEYIFVSSLHSATLSYTWLTSVELQELLVAFSPSEENIHPDSHGFRRGGHEVIFPILSLHAECDSLSGGLAGLMINIDLSDRMKINATFYFGLKKQENPRLLF